VEDRIPAQRAGRGKRHVPESGRVSGWITVGVLANADVSWAAKLGSLLLLPFAHEDLAIVFGAYFIVHDLMPASMTTSGYGPGRS
jgi:hypothetical protein